MNVKHLPEIVLIKTSKLQLNKDNPRQISKKQFASLVKSLEDAPEMFQVRPVLVSDRTGKLIVVGGNMRLRAARQLGLDKIPAIILSGLSVEKEREITIKDNGTWGEWDWDALANMWGDFDLKDWGVPGIPAVDIPDETPDTSDGLTEPQPKHTCPECGFKF